MLDRGVPSWEDSEQQNALWRYMIPSFIHLHLHLDLSPLKTTFSCWVVLSYMNVSFGFDRFFTLPPERVLPSPCRSTISQVVKILF
jgi:hypothetical protein